MDTSPYPFGVCTNSVQLGSMVKINMVKKILFKGFNFNIKCL